MALKITSRFAPSVVRAARALETIVATANIGVDDKLYAGAAKVFKAAVDDYDRLVGQSGDAKRFGTEAGECMNELKAERVRLAKERRERKLAREREKEMLVAQGAFA